jgi:hypothetical protein
MMVLRRPRRRTHRGAVAEREVVVRRAGNAAEITHEINDNGVKIGCGAGDVMDHGTIDPIPTGRSARVGR